jgi:hypothetical protein
MQLTPPSKITFWIAVILALLGAIVVLFRARLEYAEGIALLLVTAGFIILLLGNIFKKM